MAFGVKHFETITGSIVNWFSGNNSEITDFNIGSRIRTMFEAVAIELEQIYYQLFVGISGGIETAVFNSFDFPLLQARAASGTVRFSRTTPAPAGGVTIPAGTQVGTSGEDTVVYQTTDTVVIPEGATFIDATVVSTSEGSRGNAPANTVTVLLGAPAGVNSVTNQNSFFTGRDLENADERRDRFQKFIANLSRSTLGAIENAAGGVDNVVDAVAFESPRLSVFVFDSITSAFTDVSFEANLPSGSPKRALPAVVSANAALYTGADSRFGTLKADLDVGMVGGALAWEYWNGSAWVALPYSSDTTETLKKSGFLVFTKPANWRDASVNGTRKFWLRLRVTDPAMSQVATLVQIKVEPLPGIVMLVAMDASATLPSSLRTAVSNAVEGYRAAGIRVSVVPPVVTPVAVTVALTADPLADATALQALVQQRVSDFLAAFTLGRKLVLSELIQFIENQSSDITEAVVSAPSDRIDASFDEVLRPGTITIQVQQ